MTKERRNRPRVDLEVAVDVERESRLQKFYSRNLSTGGIFLIVPDSPPPEVGATLKLSFEVPSLGKTVQVEAEVLHQHQFETMDPQCRPIKQTGVGCRFLNLNPQEEEMIEQFISGKELRVRD